MLLRAEHIQPVVRERMIIKRPPAITDTYKKIGQLTGLLVIGPLALVLFACILHIPILPVIGMVMLLWLGRLIEVPLTRATSLMLWPLHRWWLQRRAPERLHHQKIRTIKVLRQPTLIALDDDRGALTIGRGRWELSRHHNIEVERAYDPDPQLRLRLFQKGADTLVLGAVLPIEAQDKLLGAFEALPRKEGGVLMLPWDDFLRLAQALRPIHEAATGRPLPAILDRL